MYITQILIIEQQNQCYSLTYLLTTLYQNTQYKNLNKSVYLLQSAKRKEIPAQIKKLQKLNMTKTYHNGPVDDSQRSKTDLPCLIIFILFNITMLVIAIYAWFSNSFSKLTTPFDPDGKGCGIDHKQHPFIYFASPHPDSLFVTTCVKSCPKQGDAQLECQTNSVVKSCYPNNNADNVKAVQIYDTEPVRGIICMPTEEKIQVQIYQALGTEAAAQKVTSLSKSWIVVLFSIPLAILLAVIFIFLMRLTASIFVYILLVMSIGSLVGFGCYLLLAPANQYATFVNVISQNHSLSAIIGVTCIILGIIIAIMAYCFRRKIQLASSIVKVSTRFVHENCPVILMQGILFAIMVVFTILWVFEALGFYSLGEPTYQEHSLPFQHYKLTTLVQAVGFVHLFYLLWCMIFLVQSGDFIVSGTVTSWYFLREQPYKQSTSRYLKYHIGSVCMGSFLISVVGFLKFIYQVLTPDSQESEGCLKYYKKFCGCCCYLCTNWLFAFLNNGAYTFIHLSGDTYCTSALQVLAVRVRDPVITSVVTILSVLFQILIRVGITALTCLCTYMILKNLQPYKSQVHDLSLTMVLIGLLGFTISSFFVSLYAQAMQAISVCYLIDKDAGGGEDKCPGELKEFLQEAKMESHNINQ